MRAVQIVLVALVALFVVCAAQDSYSFEHKSKNLKWDDIKQIIKHGEKIREVLKKKESEETESEKFNFDQLMNIFQKGKEIHDMFKGFGKKPDQEMSDINFDELMNVFQKGKEIHDMFKGFDFKGMFGKSRRQEPQVLPAETESDATSAYMTVSQLRQIMPNLPLSKANEYISHLIDAMEWANINTCERKSAFLAQVGHESAEFRYMEEIASGAAYEGRQDLGNTQPGDGRRYKGRGPIQVTGRANYRAAGRALGVNLEANPTLAAEPEWGFKVAAWYWNTRSLNRYADENTQKDFDTITRRINGGLNGKKDRDTKWEKAKSVLGC